MDRFGTSLLAASPFVLIALLAPLRREVVVGWLTITIIIGLTITYHSNGFSQINVQRYTLDWLPIVFMFLAWGMTKGRFEVARCLVLYAMGLNVVACAVSALLGESARCCSINAHAGAQVCECQR